MQPEHRAYPPGNRPVVEVQVNGRWLPGELRQWSQHEDGSWWGNVQYRPTDEPTRHYGTFSADRIRGGDAPHADSGHDPPAWPDRPEA